MCMMLCSRYSWIWTCVLQRESPSSLREVSKSCDHHYQCKLVWCFSQLLSPSHNLAMHVVHVYSVSKETDLPTHSVKGKVTSVLSIATPTVWNSLSSSTKSSTTITTFKAHLKTELSLLHTTQSNISSAAGTSHSNSRHTAPPVNVFDIDIMSIGARADPDQSAMHVSYVYEICTRKRCNKSTPEISF